jgi:hypothetical protein
VGAPTSKPQTQINIMLEQIKQMIENGSKTDPTHCSLDLNANKKTTIYGRESLLWMTLATLT